MLLNFLQDLQGRTAWANICKTYSENVVLISIECCSRLHQLHSVVTCSCSRAALQEAVSLKEPVGIESTHLRHCCHTTGP